MDWTKIMKSWRYKLSNFGLFIVNHLEQDVSYLIKFMFYFFYL